MEAGVVAIESVVLQILLIVLLVAIVARRLRVPYTVALVVSGLALAVWPQATALELTPDLVLALFLPPLVFEAALHLRVDELRRDLATLLLLAVVGTGLSTALVGGLLVGLDVLPLALALLFGALISATDPVAVVATFRALGAPRRLTTLMEGESLFNDGMAIVVFEIMRQLVEAEAVTPAEGVASFLTVSVGGLGVGLVIGFLSTQITARIDDHLIETTLSFAVAYGSYLVAEELHVSGVLAVVMAGLVKGNLGPRGMSPTTRIVLFNFWEFVAFLSNSFVFLLIGATVDFDLMLQYLQPVLVAVVAVLAARAVTVYALGGLARLLRRELPTTYLHVMVWGGLRGAVSLALVLSLPLGLELRGELLALTFGVVLFTLLAQATTIGPLLRRLGLVGVEELALAYQRRQGELLAVRAVRAHLEELRRQGALVAQAWHTLDEEMAAREHAAVEDIDALLESHPELHAELLRLARREALRAQRAALSDLAREGVLRDDIAHELQAEVDERLLALSAGNVTEPVGETTVAEAGAVVEAVTEEEAGG